MTLIAAYLTVFTAFTNEITALVALCLAFAFSSAVLHSRFLTFLIGVPAVLSFLTYASLIPVATVVSAVFIIGLGAAALLHANRLLVALCFAAALGLSLLLTKDLLLSGSSLLLLLCAVLLAVATEKKMRRTSAVCLVTGVLSVGLLLILLIGIYKANGSLDAATLPSLIDEIHGQMLAVFKENTAALPAESRILITDETFNAAFDAVLCTLPALFLASVSALVFMAQSVLFALCVSSDYAKKMTDRGTTFVLSPVTAVVYTLSVLLSVALPIFTDDARAVALTAENLSLLLMPGLLLVGFIGIRGFLEKNASCMNVWATLALVLLFFYLGGTLLYIIAFIGVYLTFRVNRVHPSLQ